MPIKKENLNIIIGTPCPGVSKWNYKNNRLEFAVGEEDTLAQEYFDSVVEYYKIDLGENREDILNLYKSVFKYRVDEEYYSHLIEPSTFDWLKPKALDSKYVEKLIKHWDCQSNVLGPLNEELDKAIEKNYSICFRIDPKLIKQRYVLEIPIFLFDRYPDGDDLEWLEFESDAYYDLTLSTYLKNWFVIKAM
jgi:hypothetical protein